MFNTLCVFSIFREVGLCVFGGGRGTSGHPSMQYKLKINDQDGGF